MRQIHSGLLGFLAITLLVGPARAAESGAITVIQKGQKRTFSVSKLRSELSETELKLDDPVYKKAKTFEGVWLKDVLKLAGVVVKPTDELVLHCADGYAPTLSADKLMEGEALLAYRDLEQKKGWEPIPQGKEKVSPAPFYLVWKSGDLKYPWPYQLVKIEVVDLAKKFSLVYPKALAPEQFADSKTTRKELILHGFEIFKDRCLKCHSINLQGGTLGPELNVPKNITEYWDDEVLTEFIRDPSSFRARSKMPAFPGLEDRDLDALLRYFKFVKKHKKES